MSRESSLPEPTKNPGLDAWQWQALTVAAKPADKLRDALEPRLGAPIDFRARFRGYLDLARGQTYQVRQAPKTADLLALVLLQLTPRVRRRVLSDLAQLANDTSATHFPGEAVEGVEAVIAAYTRQVAQNRRGVLNGKIDVELLRAA